MNFIWPNGKSMTLSQSSLSLVLIGLLVVGFCDAIVTKQTSQASPSPSSSSSAAAASPVASASSQQQARSDDVAQVTSQQQQSQSQSFNNHQSQAAQQQQQSASSQSSYSPSVSVSGSSSSPSASSSISQLPSQSSNAARSDQYAYTNSQASGPKYMDNISAVSGNPEQSYQAAASSVNMALANSGIYNSGYQSAPGNQQSNSQSLGSQANSVQSLNPLHYFYYPPKESNGAPKASDMMAHSSNNNYQSMAYPSYVDQLAGSYSTNGAQGPEASASNQDASYLPQPSLGLGDPTQPINNMYNSNQANAQPGSGQAAPNQQQTGAQQQHSGFNDMNGYSNGVSFSGPSSGGPSSAASNSVSEYSSQQQGSNQQQPQQQPQMGPSGYQGNSLYNQLGDLSTSNFGNNPGGLSSVASYMAPSQQVSVGGQQGLNQELFGNTNSMGIQQQFNSAASQLSPASVSPPNQQQQGSSLFGSSLFGTQQSASSSSANGANQLSNNLYTNQNYLNSYLTPQQYTQLTGQQMPTSMEQLQQQQSQLSQSAVQPIGSSSNAVSSSTGSKRFGISSFIMPMLAIAGLSLLIPTVSQLSPIVGRKKRSVDDRASVGNRHQSIAFDSVNGIHQLAKENSIGEYMDRIERYYSIYRNAVESDDCLNRLICEFGDAVKDVTGKSAIMTVIEKLVPDWMVGKVHLFKDAALDNKEGKEKCKKYVCNTNRRF